MSKQCRGNAAFCVHVACNGQAIQPVRCRQLNFLPRADTLSQGETESKKSSKTAVETHTELRHTTDLALPFCSRLHFLLSEISALPTLSKGGLKRPAMRAQWTGYQNTEP